MDTQWILKHAVSCISSRLIAGQYKHPIPHVIIWRFPKMEVPQNGWFTNLGVSPFSETPIYLLRLISSTVLVPRSLIQQAVNAAYVGVILSHLKLAILRMGVTHGSPRPLLSILIFFEKSLSYFGYVWIIAANCRVPPFSELPTLHQVPLTPFQPHDGCAVLGGTFFQSSDMLQNLSAGAQFSENRASSTMLVPEIIWNPLVSRSISKVAQWYLDFVFPP